MLYQSIVILSTDIIGHLPFRPGWCQYWSRDLGYPSWRQKQKRKPKVLPWFTNTHTSPWFFWSSVHSLWILGQILSPPQDCSLPRGVGPTSRSGLPGWLMDVMHVTVSHILSSSRKLFSAYALLWAWSYGSWSFDNGPDPLGAVSWGPKRGGQKSWQVLWQQVCGLW